MRCSARKSTNSGNCDSYTNEVTTIAQSRKTDDGTATASDRPPRTPARPPARIHDDIARRAYGLYLARDGAHGHDLADWLQAEQELRGTVTARATRRRRTSS